MMGKYYHLFISFAVFDVCHIVTVCRR